LLSSITVSRLTSIRKSAISSGHTKLRLLLLSVLWLGGLVGCLSGIDVVFIVLNILDLKLGAIGFGVVFEHEGW